MSDLTVSDLLSSSLFVVADEDRWPGLIASVTGAHITVYTWDESLATIGDSLDAFDSGRLDGIYAASTKDYEEHDETIKDRMRRVETILDRIATGDEDSD